MTSQQQMELLPLYPLGLLDEEELSLVQAAAREEVACEELAWELACYQEVAALCALAAPPVSPNPQVRSRLLGSLPLPFTEAEPGIFVHRASRHNWTRTPFPGVSVKQVSFDQATSMATHIIRMDPGAAYPHHKHSADEQCYVISGEIRLGTVVLREGDFSRAAAGSHHGKVWTEKGCTLLVVASIKDELGD